MTRAAGPRSLKVGVSIFLRDEKQSLWENGIHQNVLFLAMLLQRSPIVAETFLVAGGNTSLLGTSALLADAPAPVIGMEAALARLDVLIEMSAQLDREWAVAFRARGGRIASMRVGNDYVIDIERMMFDLPNALLISGAPYDAVWTLPQYADNCAPYFRATFRAPVRIVPHLWSPVLLDRAAARLPAGRRFGYQPGRRRWRAAMFEPNVCMVKTSFIPMLCCEAAHRRDPDVLERVWVYNGKVLEDRPTFRAFADGLDIVRHGLVVLEGRYPFCDIVSGNVDAVVSHQWENAQNYVYYEALHGGYPLIHNSLLIGDCGYRYDGFDAQAGGATLLRAFAMHDADLVTYRREARAFLRMLDPHHPDNVTAYTAALHALCEGAEGGGGVKEAQEGERAEEAASAPAPAAAGGGPT